MGRMHGSARGGSLMWCVPFIAASTMATWGVILLRRSQTGSKIPWGRLAPRLGAGYWLLFAAALTWPFSLLLGAQHRPTNEVVGVIVICLLPPLILQAEHNLQVDRDQRE